MTHNIFKYVSFPALARASPKGENMRNNFSMYLNIMRFSVFCFLFANSSFADTWTTNNAGRITTQNATTRVGVGLTGNANIRGALDVRGSATIGSAYAGNPAVNPPANGLLVEGNVGVGTAVPARRLDVVGTVRATALEGNDIFPVTSFGVVSNNLSVDYTAQFNNALNAAAPTGGVVYVPAGQYSVNGCLTVPVGVTLQGSWVGPHTALLNLGTTLLTNCGNGQPNGTPFITLADHASIKGLTIYYWQQSPPTNNSWQPIQFSWTIRGSAHNNVEDIAIPNTFQGIDFATNNSFSHHIRNIYMTAIQNGVSINRCLDVGRLENVHINPNIWQAATNYTMTPATVDLIAGYTSSHLYAFQFGRTDWQNVSSCFAIYALVGMHFYGTSDPMTLPSVQVVNSGIDQSRYAVYVDRVNIEPYGVSFNNCNFVGSIAISSNNTGPVRMNNCWFLHSDAPHNGGVLDMFKQDGTGTLMIANSNIGKWAGGLFTSAIKVNNGAVMVQNSEFWVPPGPNGSPIATVGSAGALNFIGNRVGLNRASPLIVGSTGSFNAHFTITK